VSSREQVLRFIEKQFEIVLCDNGMEQTAASVIEKNPSLDDYSKMIRVLPKALDAYDSIGALPSWWTKQLPLNAIIMSEVEKFLE
jgi:hypothetical protein